MVSLRRRSNKTTTSSIPIPRAHITRTNSEIQLENDTKLYEWREGVMYYRLVSGMIQRSKELGNHPSLNKTIQNVMLKRQASCEVSGTAASPSSDSGYTSGSSSCCSYDDNDEWLFYEDVQEIQVPLSSTAQADPQDCSLRRHSCPGLALCEWNKSKEDCADSSNRDGADDDTVFELEL